MNDVIDDIEFTSSCTFPTPCMGDKFVDNENCLLLCSLAMPRRLMNYVHCLPHTSSQNRKQYNKDIYFIFGISHPGSANKGLCSRIKESSKKL